MGEQTKPSRSEKSEDGTGQYMKQIGQTALLTAADEFELGTKIQAGIAATEELEHAPEIREYNRMVDAERAEGIPGVRYSSRYLPQLRREAKEGDAARDHMIRANLRLVVSIARRYKSETMTLDDVVQEGNFGVIRAAEKFDPRKGFKFSTYATWWIRQAISRGMADKENLIRVPNGALEQNRALEAVRRELNSQGIDNPTYEQLSEITDLPVEKIKQVESRVRRATVLASLNTVIGEGGPGTKTSELQDVIQDKSALDPQEEIVQTHNKQVLEDMLRTLDVRDRVILSARFGLSGEAPKTLAEIGQMLGITRERARQLESRAIVKIRHSFEDPDKLDDWLTDDQSNPAVLE